MKKSFKIIIIVLTLILSSSIIYLSLFKSEPKKLTLAISADLDTFDPANAFNDESLKVLSQVFEPLYQYHYLKRPYEIESLIAEGLPTISADGLTYTIKIKKNVRYHSHPAFDGPRYVKAEDFVNQIKRLAFKPIKSNGKWIFSNRVRGFDEFSETVGDDFEKLFEVNLNGVEIVDDYTFKIKLIAPDSRFIYFLAMNFIVPMPIEIINYFHNDLSSIMIGTGPYYLSSWSVNDAIHLKRFKDYREDMYPSSGDRYANTNEMLLDRQKKIPFLDEITIKIIKDVDQQWEQFFEGKIDVLDVPKHRLGEVVNAEKKFEKKGIRIRHTPALSTRWLSFNIKNKKNNEYVRKAVAYAIDYDEYLEQLFNNTHLRANSIYVPGINAYDPTSKLPYTFNIELAKEYLKKAGHGPKNPLKLKYATRSTTQASINEAQLIKKMLEKIDIKVDIQILEFKDFLMLGRAGKLDFFTDQWIYDYPDAENMLQLLLTKNHPGINKSGYSNKTIDDLYAKLLMANDDLSKIEIFHEVENIVNNELPWIMLTFESTYILHNERIKNWRSSSVMRNFFKYINVAE